MNIVFVHNFCDYTNITSIIVVSVDVTAFANVVMMVVVVVDVVVVVVVVVVCFCYSFDNETGKRSSRAASPLVIKLLITSPMSILLQGYSA